MRGEANVRVRQAAGGLLLAVGAACGTPAAELSSDRQLEFSGALHEPKEISGAALVGDLLLIVSDEGGVLQALEPAERSGAYVLRSKYELPEGRTTDRTEARGAELDLEGIAANGETVYVVGSHSMKRARVDPKETSRDYAKNLKRMGEVESERSRRVLFRMKLDAGGRPRDIVAQKGLHDLLEEHPVLGRFTAIPGKENGVDIEGIAVDGRTIYLGFRGPVLRENWVPVLRTDFELSEARVLYVNLSGLGIRDMTRVDDGFLIVAGPVGGGPGTYELYHWNGEDCIPGTGGASGRLRHLGRIPGRAGAGAEGIAVIAEREQEYRVIIVYDGARGGAAGVFRIPR